MAKKMLKTLRAPKETSKKASSAHPPKTFCDCTQFCHKRLTLRAKKRHYKNAGHSFSDLEESSSDLDMDGIFDDIESE